MNIAVLGLWHLGCVTAACVAERFPAVVGLDFDEALLAKLRDGRAPLAEPGLDDLLRTGLDAGRLRFANPATPAGREALAITDVLWVCDDTPVDENDVADVPYVLDRLERCLPHLHPDAVVLLSSQVPAGTCRALEGRHPGRAFAYSPENLRLGKALDVFRHPERIVAGVRDEATRQRLAPLFAPFCGRVLWMSPESAEMTKHGINAFLALCVTFANELARVGEAVGADAREVERGLRSEPRIGEKAYIRPGAAFAGGTLARDVVALTRLAADRGETVALFPAVLASNEAHKGWAFRKLQARFGSDLKGREVAVLGLTYKPGTDTLRRSAAVELSRALLAADARVRVFDPAVRAEALPSVGLADACFCAGLPAALAGADAAVMATEWPEIQAADWPALLPTMRRPLVLDANRFLPALPAGTELLAVGVADATSGTKHAA